MCATRSLTLDEQAEMASTLRTARDRLLFLTGVYTGFRVHELLAIRVGDVWKNGKPAAELTLSRRLLKGGAGVKPERVRSRTAHVPPALKAAVEAFVNEKFAGVPPPPEEFLFRSRKGKNRPIAVSHAWEIIKTAARQLGLGERVATHSMRKCFAKSVYENSGHDLILTQRALGHRAMATTARYLESSDGAVKAAFLGIRGPAGGLPKSEDVVEKPNSAIESIKEATQEDFALEMG